jgi:hypothetical protein
VTLLGQSDRANISVGINFDDKKVINHWSRVVRNLERTDDHAYKLYTLLNTARKPTITNMATVLNFQLPSKLKAYTNTCLNSFAQKENKNTFIFRNL